MDKVPVSSAAGTLVTAGSARVVVDNYRPINFDSPKPQGTEYPAPLQYTLASLCACTMLMVEAIGNELNMGIEKVETAADAHIDPSGMKGVADIKPYFNSIEQTIRIKAKNEDKIDQLQDLMRKRCPMACLIEDTHLPYNLRYEFLH
jgi:uncharacterized OsmC-like protein